MVQQRDKRRAYIDSGLMKIPILGYLLRKIAEHRKPIETALRTKRKIEEEIRKESFLGGLITITSKCIFNTLKLRGKK